MDTDWDVNEILGHIKHNGLTYYLVKWGASEEPEHMLIHCPEKLKQYWDNLLRDSFVSSSSKTAETIEIAESQNFSTLQSAIPIAESKLVSVQSQTDTNQTKVTNTNLPKKLKKKQSKLFQGQDKNFCQHCSKTFFNAGSLKRHEREIHKINTKFKCTLCHTEFSRKKTLETHEFRCNFKFKNLLYLKW